MDCSLPGSSVHGILQARILGWVAMPLSGGIFPTQGSNPRLLCLLAGGFFTTSITWEAHKRQVKWKSLSHVWLCDPTDYTVHGILQARILEWIAFSFSRGSSQLRDQTQVSHTAGRFFTSWATREAHKREELLVNHHTPFLTIRYREEPNPTPLPAQQSGWLPRHQQASTTQSSHLKG